MFLSDKDLRKPVPKRQNPSSSGKKTDVVAAGIVRSSKESAEDIAERAKAERLQRQHQREQSKFALLIETWWRKYHNKNKFMQQLESILLSKLLEIQKLAKLLQSKGVSVFVPPVDTCKQLLSTFLLLSSLSKCQHTDLLVKLSSLVFYPSATQEDATKNIALKEMSTSLGKKRWKQIIVLTLSTKVSNALDSGSLANLLSVLLLSPSLSSLQTFLLDSSTSFLLTLISTYFASLCAPLVRVKKTEEHRSLGVLEHVAYIQSRCNLSTTLAVPLWEIIMEYLKQGKINADDFLDYIFSLPCVLLTLPLDSVRVFVASPAFALLLPGLVSRLRSSTLASTQHDKIYPALTVGQWVYGNLLYILLVLLPTPPTHTHTADTLQPYLSLLIAYMDEHFIPGMLAGGEGVVWVKGSGTATTSLTAWGVPYALSIQASCPLHPPVMHALSAIALPLSPLIPPADWLPYSNPADVQAVHNFLQQDEATSSAATVSVAQEKDSWFTGKWAQKLLGGLVGGSSAGNLKTSEEPKKKTGGLLSWFGGAGGSGAKTKTTIPQPLAPPAPLPVHADFFLSFCEFYSRLLCCALTSTPDSAPYRALCSLAFFSPFTWGTYIFLWERAGVANGGGWLSGDWGKSGAESRLEGLLRNFAVEKDLFHAQGKESSGRSVFSVLWLLSLLLKMQLVVLDEREVYQMEKPLPLPMLPPVLRMLKHVLHLSLRHAPLILEGGGEGKGASSSILSDAYATGILRSIQDILSDYYIYWARRPFSSPDLWHISALNTSSFLDSLRAGDSVSFSLLQALPYAIDFPGRLRLMRGEMDREREAIQGTGYDGGLWGGGGWRSKGIAIRVRRGNVLGDSLRQLLPLAPSIWRDRILIRYVNDFGEEEKGIDSGGLFKDYLVALSEQIFSAAAGLFCTTDDMCIYPNPQYKGGEVGSNAEDIFMFIGRVVGKAIFENISLPLSFAYFLLSFLTPKYHYTHLINELRSLDKELHKNLMFLKYYEGDVGDLGLTFSVTEEGLFGRPSRDLDLIPGGRSVEVTAQNKHRYINLVAKYYLHDRIRIQGGAFFKGVYEVVGGRGYFGWFSPPELQVLISGVQKEVDIEELRQYTRYAGYLPLDGQISRFWSVVSTFTAQEKSLLLQFVTACPRPPPLGFSALHPPFTVQKAEGGDEGRLPTSSTCFNILKLPAYSSQKIMREKILQAITSKAGFDLS